jgi:uncharacterized protein (TIGR02246 family)
MKVSMNIPAYKPQNPEEAAVCHVYQQLLQCWNAKNAQGMATLFAEKGSMVGFDGSHVNGPAEIFRHLSPIFSDHPTARYVWKVREMRRLTSDVVLLRAVAGMIPPGKSGINPATNVIQSLVACLYNSLWKIELYQNTPA